MSESLLDAAIAGLSGPAKAMSPKWFYDDRGSALFDRITALEAYYPTRVEGALLAAHAREMTAGLGRGVALVEWGSGSSLKTPPILRALDSPALYAPIDVSTAALEAAFARLRPDFRDLPIVPIEADFTAPFALPPEVAAAPARLGFFPGSTIGNFDPPAAIALLAAAREALGPGARFLLGVDTPKDPETLERAYDDPEGVTAAFNRNLIHRLNRELDAGLDPSAFRHEARWNETARRVEMRLVCTRAQTARLGDVRIAFAPGESIHTESAYKLAPDEVEAMAACAGWRLERAWLAPADAFGLYRLAA